MVRCSECRATRRVGSRCLRCFVSRRARALRINKYKWFTANRDKMEKLLTGRMMALEIGEEPPPIDLIIRIFHTSKHTFHRGGSAPRILPDGTLVHYPAKFSSELKIKKLISDFDLAVLGGKDVGKEND